MSSLMDRYRARRTANLRRRAIVRALDPTEYAAVRSRLMEGGRR